VKEIVMRKPTLHEAGRLWVRSREGVDFSFGQMLPIPEVAED
jgi:hypothetical protein